LITKLSVQQSQTLNGWLVAAGYDGPKPKPNSASMPCAWNQRPAATPPGSSRAVLGHRLAHHHERAERLRERDIALVIADWSLKSRGADGRDVDMSGSTADVARRGADGWKFVVANPFGTGRAKM
jgi:hypothetical protein